MKKIFIIRSGNPEFAGTTSLKDKSKRKIQRTAVDLIQREEVIHHAFHGSSKADKESCHKALKAAGISLEIVGGTICSESIFTTLVNQHDDNFNIVIFLAKDQIEELCKRLAIADLPLKRKGKKLPAASLLTFTHEDEWNTINEENLKFQSCTFPDKLPKLFPFPQENGFELRPRPAYYYSQSGVIPWKSEDGRLLIMLISTGSRRKWTIPKGIAEPDMTPWESAAKEAFEEAGIRGNVSEHPFATWNHSKWGASCQVAIYTLHVRRTLDISEWEEPHRLRRWFPVEEAADTVSFPDLKPLIRQFATLFQQGKIHA